MMSAELKRLIKNLPKDSLEAYFTKFHADVVDDFDWSVEEKTVKKSLKEICFELIGDPFALMNARAERIDTLTDELGQSMLFHSVDDEEVEEYSKLENEYDRAAWLFLKDDDRFSQVEDSYYVDTRRHGRMYDGFIGPKNVSVQFDGDPLKVFKAKVLELYRAAGNIKVEHYKRMRPEGEDQEIEVIQIMVYREDLPIMVRTFEEKELVTRTFKPVKEFALTYEPKEGVIEVVTEHSDKRKDVALIFSETLLKSPIKGEKIPLKQYSIQKLLNPVELSFDPSDGIASVKVTRLKVARPNSNNTVTLDVSAKENARIYDISKDYFGENDPLKTGFRLKEVRISIKFKPDSDNRRGITIHVNIGEPNRCNLKDKSQKERLIGEKYLKQWELVETIG
ncbi:MAG: hypothetical protein AB2697_02535 [Candidatus Thiodiazotropha endolucinida]